MSIDNNFHLVTRIMFCLYRLSQFNYSLANEKRSKRELELTLKDQNDNISEKCEDIVKRVRNALDENVKVKQNFQTQVTSFHTYVTKIVTAISEYSLELISKQTTKNKLLSQKYDKISSENHSLLERIEFYQSHITQAESECKRLKEIDISNLKAQNEKLHHTVSSQKKQIRSKQRDINDEKQQIKHLSSKVKDLEHEIRSQNEKILNLTAQNEVTEHKYHEQKNQLKFQHENEINKLHSEKTKIDAEYKDMQQKLRYYS